MAIDRQKNLYVITRGCVEIFNSNGDFIGYVKIPGMPTNCCFGGQDLSTLYVTSRQLYVANRHRIYSVKTNTKGIQYPLR